MAAALPEVQWLEYSFQNFDHLVDEPVPFAPPYGFDPIVVTDVGQLGFTPSIDVKLTWRAQRERVTEIDR